MKINIIGNISGVSGYSMHTKNLANALYKINPEVHLSTPLFPGWELQVNDAELKMITSEWYEDGVTVAITMPPYWPIHQTEKQKKFAGFLVWEGDKVPASFLSLLDNCDVVLVPSNHVEKAILNACVYDNFNGRNSPIKLVPHGVDTDLFVPQPKPPIFTFVNNKGWVQGINDRGGVQWLLEAYCNEFRKDEPVNLLLKINPAYCPQGWDFGKEMEKLNLPKEHAPISVNVDSINYKHMPKLYTGHCFVSPTMGEAFSIPCAEALSCGLPVITTDWGGQIDFVNRKNGWLIRSTPVEVTHDWMYEGVSWHKPDIADLRKLMRYAFEHPEECEQMGITGRTEMQSYFEWKDSAKKLLEALK